MDSIIHNVCHCKRYMEFALQERAAEGVYMYVYLQYLE